MQTLIKWVQVADVRPENRKLYRTIIKLKNRSEFETICAYNNDWDEYAEESTGKLYTPEEVRLIASYDPPREGIRTVGIPAIPIRACLDKMDELASMNSTVDEVRDHMAIWLLEHMVEGQNND